MEALAAIGLIGNIFTFIDVGFKVTNAVRDLEKSVSGSTTENEHLELLTTQIQGFTLDLQTNKPVSDLNTDEQRLDKLAKECHSLSQDLLKLLQDLQVKGANKKSKRKAVGAALRNLYKKDEKDDLVTRLERCKQQLHLESSRMVRMDTQARLTAIINSGKCHESELQKLSQNVETLRNGVHITSLGQELLSDIRRLLDLTDEARSQVLQNTILQALQQDKMGARYDAVETAYERTFDWLFDDEYQRGRGPPYSLRMDEKRQEARETFTNWLSNGDGVFHISGKPGAGKSTLMKYICQSDHTFELLADWARPKKLVTARFFFWKYGTEAQNSWNGFIRSLLLSIVSECPQLIESVFAKQWQLVKDSKPCHLSADEINHAFMGIMTRNDVFKKHKFAFLVDGLDEFVGRDDKLVSSFFSWIYAWPNDIKFCVSSRELPIFQQRFSKCPKIRVHELTEADMQIIMEDTLKKNQDFKAMSEAVGLEIISLGNALLNEPKAYSSGLFLR